ncbi:hypothetical protein N7539_006131 [Penicillium diatomitis]|uniref:Secreted protein n=1 Tax=Penicillium diatomitis TaxID=2819901 RepID=A0A9W9X349_9EURO|nr:uncharacterized protein N7539_006131 [Penicillium diatomitis]KAJ5482685.1 hypothetical protein N7539_006131 [Penicillium diatomitis]
MGMVPLVRSRLIICILCVAQRRSVNPDSGAAVQSLLTTGTLSLMVEVMVGPTALYEGNKRLVADTRQEDS